VAARQEKLEERRVDRKLEAVAKAIFWEMNSVMHDHDKVWKASKQQGVYRDCARAALVAAAHFETAAR
jgi:hypothetical protein